MLGNCFQLSRACVLKKFRLHWDKNQNLMEQSVRACNLLKKNPLEEIFEQWEGFCKD